MFNIGTKGTEHKPPPCESYFKGVSGKNSTFSKYQPGALTIVHSVALWIAVQLI